MLREMGVHMWTHESSPSSALATEPARAATTAASMVAAREPVAEAVASPPTSRPQQAPLPYSGPWAEADWLVVGESFESSTSASAAAPPVGGEQERLLANMLHAVRVSRDAPERSGRACHMALQADGSGPLDAALQGIRPRVVLALGRAAAQALLDIDEPLGRLRGCVHEREGVKVVVTFPLAYLLRHPHEKAKAWVDLCLAASTLEGSGL